MIKAFVFGKFLPFHKGHEAMIRFALHHADFLSVLVCCSDQEPIPPQIRKDWIERSFEGVPQVEVHVFEYKESELPNSSESSKSISKKWAQVFKRLFPDYQRVITSEPYGDFVAGYMGIQHIPFDPERKQFPIAAHLITQQLQRHWHFLPDVVKPWFVKKIAILGTESTGKSTLAQQLAAYLKAAYVPEAGRDIIPDSSSFTFDELEKVALVHGQRIQKAMIEQGPLLVLDTDIHITMSYARFMFAQSLPCTNELYALNRADIYLYLNADVPYVQDGTRLPEAQRNALDISHRAILKEYEIPFVEIEGNWNQRWRQAIAAVSSLNTYLYPQK
jgi:HTH-type transcriptional repressor of NAD biosynthesis genes